MDLGNKQFLSTAPEVMKLIFAVSYVSWTMGLTCCYKTEDFLHLYLQFVYNINFYALSITDTC